MITIIQQPQANTPAFNDQWFTATSNQTAQPNFQFYVKVTVHYHNGLIYTTKVYNIPSNTPPDGILRFNARIYAENFIKNFLQLHSTGWLKCLNGVIKLVVNVGERYDSGAPPVLTIFPGSDYTYYAWNASLEFTEFGAAYNPANYVANNGAAFPILNDYPDTRTSLYSQNWLYIYCASDNVLQKARVHSTDGSAVAFFDIANPLLASGNWYDRYLALNISPSRLAILGGVNFIAVEGTSYSVVLYDNTGTIRKTIDFTYSHVCSKFFKYQQVYLNRKGAFDHFFFEMVSEEDYDAKKTKVSHTPYIDTAGTGAMTYQPDQRVNYTHTSQYNKSLTIQTNWITETQSATLRDLMTSTTVLIQEVMGSAIIFFAVNNQDTKYKRKRNFNGKLFNLLSNLNLGFDNNRQKGA